VARTLFIDGFLALCGRFMPPLPPWPQWWCPRLPAGVPTLRSRSIVPSSRAPARDGCWSVGVAPTLTSRGRLR